MSPSHAEPGLASASSPSRSAPHRSSSGRARKGSVPAGAQFPGPFDRDRDRDRLERPDDRFDDRQDPRSREEHHVGGEDAGDAAGAQVDLGGDAAAEDRTVTVRHGGITRAFHGHVRVDPGVRGDPAAARVRGERGDLACA